MDSDSTLTQMLVPDNLSRGVTKAHRYEQHINPSYRDLAEHYGVAVLPARSRKPKDKAKVDVGVQVVGRWSLAVLRNCQFFSFGELNTAIALLLDPPSQALQEMDTARLRHNVCSEDIDYRSPGGLGQGADLATGLRPMTT